MKLEEVKRRIRCEMPNCKNLAKIKVVKEGFIHSAGLYLCDDCKKALYEELAKNVVPKSPTNVFNKSKGGSKK